MKHLTELRLSDGIFNLNDHCSQIALPTVERIQLNTMGILSSDAPTQHTFSMYCLCVLNVRPQICDRLAAIFPNVAEIELDYQFPELVALLENKEKFPHLRKVQTTDDVFKEYGMQSGEDAKNK